MPIWLAQQFEGPVSRRCCCATTAGWWRRCAGGDSARHARRQLGRDPRARSALSPPSCPWNVPQAITFLKLAPALAAGCTVVLKPAPETVLDALLMAEAAVEAGLPAGVLNVVPGGREVGAYLVAHPGVDKVSFTGSTAAGRAIGRDLRPAAAPGHPRARRQVGRDRARRRRPGSRSIESFFAATLLNNGQICWLGTRVLAPRSRYDDVVDTITGLAGSLTVGDPMDPSTQVGPLVSSRQRDRVESYIAKGMNDGARLTTGGRQARRSRTRAGSSSRPCSPTSTTSTRSPRRRSSARCSP